MTNVPALPGHALFLLLVQVALILCVSRLLAEVMKRIGQPAVLGELMAGLVLGPSLLGRLWPGAFHALFPAEAAQVHLLEVVAWIGMVLLLLLTGLETDVRLLRHLGRSALTSSALGMLIPFVCGLVLGLATYERFMGPSAGRLLFSLFLATALSISAMPVIAKILFDLELTKRNIGVVILSAGAVDDTTGWLILSVLVGVAKADSGIVLQLLQLLKTVALTGAFLLACVFVVFPVTRWLLRVIDDRARTPNADLPMVIAVTFVMAAVTERIHIHAVFGAFVAGCLFRQIPHLRPATIHKIEGVAVPIFAPIFFGLVGLKVDLTTLSSAKMVLLVIGVATAGKLIGCTWGGLLGRMSFFESVSIGVAMNARGGMGLVVALIGLSSGIVNQEMYGLIVVMAIVTSFMAPIGLRLTLPWVKMSPEEEARIAAQTQRGLFDPARLKVLIPTAGGPNALLAGRIASSLARGEIPTMTLLYVQSAALSLARRVWKRLVPDQAGKNLQEHLEVIRGYADERQVRLETRRESESDAVTAICKEAAHGFDLLLLGAGLKNPLRSSVMSPLLERAPCHIAIVRGRGAVLDAKRILVASNGSYFSRAAIELAILYAEKVDAHVTVLHYMEPDDDQAALDFEADTASRALDENFRHMIATTLLTTLSPLLAKTQVKVAVAVRQSDQPTPPLVAEAKTGVYDLLIVGTENRAVQHRLAVGYDIDKIVADVPCSVMVVVPKISGGPAHA